MWIGMWLETDNYQFEGCDGRIHSFQGPSVAGSYQFVEHLAGLGGILDEHPDQTGTELYRTHKLFQWLVDRCLQLNHIEPEWVSWRQVERFLFGWVDEGGVAQPAILVRIQAEESPQPLSASEELTLEEVAALLAESQGGINAATNLLNNLTLKQLRRILSAQAKRAKSTASPEASPEKFDETEGLQRLRQHMMEQAGQVEKQPHGDS
jgi:hypothetical protein